MKPLSACGRWDAAPASSRPTCLKRAAVQRIVDATVKELGGIDILLNNAGIIRRAPLLEFTEKDWDEVIQIDESAVFFLSQAVARQMVKQGRGGKIINIASLLVVPGRYSRAILHCGQERGHGPDASHGNELAPHRAST